MTTKNEIKKKRIREPIAKHRDSGYEYELGCWAPVEFWSNVLPSATGGRYLTEEVCGTRLGVAVAEQKAFLAEARPQCRDGGSVEPGMIRNQPSGAPKIRAMQIITR